MTRTGALAVTGTPGGISTMIIQLIISSLSILFVTYVFDGIEIDSITTAVIAAIALGLINTFIRPVIILFTLPFTVITFGIFLLFINAGMLYLTAWLIDGFHIDSYLDALIASVFISIVTAFLNHVSKSK